MDAGPLFGFMVYEKPEPLTDTRYVREVPERIGADGTIIEPIDEAAVREAIEELVADGVEALTVCLLNAHANGRHERVVAEIAAEVAPDLPVSISSEILPEFREYERTVTTLVNAYVAPVLEKYLTNVRDGLAAAHVRAPIQVVRSDGGLMSLESACQNPVQTVLSAPPAVSAARRSSRRTPDSTASSPSTWAGPRPMSRSASPAGRRSLARRSVGDFPVRAPAVDVASIGAGGGSIAYVAEATGALRVGPQSAGAFPGRPATGAAGPPRPSPTRTSSSATCRRVCSAASSHWTSTPPTTPSRASPRRGRRRRGDGSRDREHGRRGDARRASRRHRPAGPGAQ